jgi:hypothetical protein
MATQKQRRRRAKEKRHDYDLLFIDEDGVEKPVEREETPRKPSDRAGKGGSTVSKSKKTSASAKRRGKELQPPSWPKVLKRGALFAPVFFVTVMFIGGSKGGIPSAILQTVLLLGAFIPFSYFMDRLFWRQQQKRLGRGA